MRSATGAIPTTTTPPPDPYKALPFFKESGVKPGFLFYWSFFSRFRMRTGALMGIFRPSAFISGRIIAMTYFSLLLFEIPPAGIEPATFGAKIRYSTS
jgi:hypothetical protein